MRSTRRIALVSALALSIGALVSPGGAAASESAYHSGFVHPGVGLSAGQLHFIREQVREGAQSWAGAYQVMKSSNYASLSYVAQPRADVECGSYSNPNLGCTEEREDAIAAYTDALMWTITHDHRYADKAIDIMDAWARTLQEHTNSNAPLQSGWASASWARAGEIIRYTYDGWARDKLDRFATMLRDVYLPLVIQGAPDKNGNWELIMMDAAASISVFLNDRASFDQAVAIWRARVPAYIYLSTDGPLPNPPPRGTKTTPEQIIAYWQGQSTFVDGLAQETCRDFGHTGWGIDAAARLAETGRIQGLDLYKEVEERMVKTLEFHAQYELGAVVPSWLCGGTVKTGLGDVLEVAYNEYHNRLGIPLPYTAQVIQRDRPGDTDDHYVAWETLTHAGG